MRVGKLISTGYITEKTGKPLRTVHRLIVIGAIPKPFVLEGSGKFVWRIEDYPAIEQAVLNYRDGRFKPARELVSA